VRGPRQLLGRAVHMPLRTWAETALGRLGGWRASPMTMPSSPPTDPGPVAPPATTVSPLHLPPRPPEGATHAALDAHVAILVAEHERRRGLLLRLPWARWARIAYSGALGAIAVVALMLAARICGALVLVRACAARPWGAALVRDVVRGSGGRSRWWVGGVRRG
jgi:hypothetical protein